MRRGQPTGSTAEVPTTSWLVDDDPKSDWYEPPGAGPETTTETVVGRTTGRDDYTTDSLTQDSTAVVQRMIRTPEPASPRAALQPEPVGEGPPQPSAPTVHRVRRRRPRVRKVTRIVRRVDAWSVFKVAAIFWLTIYLVMLVAGVLLWSVMDSTGLLSNVESFFRTTFAGDTFAFKGGQIYHAYWMLGLLGVVAASGMSVALAVFFNLISDLTGGVRVTVLEEEIELVQGD